MTNLLTAIVKRVTAERLLIVALAVALGWSYITGSEPTPRMAVEWKQHAMTEDDVPEATTANAVTVYEKPDSTRTECFQSPTWMGSLSETDSGSVSSSLPAQDGAQTRQSATPLRGFGGLPYVITPMTQERPALSVGRQTVTLSAVDPRDGRGLQFEYDIPQANNRISPYATTQLLPGTAAIHSGLQYARTFRDAWIFSSMTAEWSGGYGITGQGQGIVSGVTLTADIRW